MSIEQIKRELKKLEFLQAQTECGFQAKRRELLERLYATNATNTDNRERQILQSL